MKCNPDAYDVMVCGWVCDRLEVADIIMRYNGARADEDPFLDLDDEGPECIGTIVRDVMKIAVRRGA